MAPPVYIRYQWKTIFGIIPRITKNNANRSCDTYILLDDKRAHFPFWHEAGDIANRHLFLVGNYSFGI